MYVAGRGWVTDVRLAMRHLAFGDDCISAIWRCRVERRRLSLRRVLLGTNRQGKRVRFVLWFWQDEPLRTVTIERSHCDGAGTAFQDQHTRRTIRCQVGSRGATIKHERLGSDASPRRTGVDGIGTSRAARTTGDQLDTPAFTNSSGRRLDGSDQFAFGGHYSCRKSARTVLPTT